MARLACVEEWEVGIQGGGMSFTGTLLTSEQNHLFVRERDLGDDPPPWAERADTPLCCSATKKNSPAPPNTSPSFCTTLSKPWARRKSLVPPTALTSGVLLCTNREIKKKGQSDKGFCWTDLGRKGRLYAWRLISSGKRPSFYASLKQFGNNGEENH